MTLKKGVSCDPGSSAAHQGAAPDEAGDFDRCAAGEIVGEVDSFDRGDKTESPGLSARETSFWL